MELQICVALGNLFTQIKDLSKAVVFLKNALGLLKTVSIVDVQVTAPCLRLRLSGETGLSELGPCFFIHCSSVSANIFR